MKRLFLKLIAVVSLIVGMVSMLAACSSSKAALEKIDLNNYRWAIFLSSEPDHSIFFTPKLRGYVLFLKEDGSYDLVKNSGMSSGKISWTNKSLYYADTQTDNFKNNHQTQTESLSHNSYMHGLVTLQDQQTRVSLYNVGGRKGSSGYIEDVVIANGTSSKLFSLKTTLPHHLISACGNDVYGAREENDAVNNVVNFRFDKIVDNSSFNFSNITTTKLPLSEQHFYMIDAPCVNNKITFLAGNYYSKSNPFSTENFGSYVNTISTIDTRTGKLTSLPLQTPEGKPLKISLSELLLSQYDAQSIDNNGIFTWVAGNGSILQTALTTGKTTVLNSTLTQSDNSNDRVEWMYFFDSTPTSINVLVQPSPLRAYKSRILKIDRRTGKVIHDVTLSNLKDTIPDGVFVQDIAGKP